jgi:hypothetical protein
MPYFVFQKPMGTANWTLKGSFQDYGAARAARDKHANEEAKLVARMVSARSESEARGKTGSAWNAITHDPERQDKRDE